MAIAHNDLKKKLDDKGFGYSVSGTDVTITGTLTWKQLEEVGKAAEVTGYQLVIVAGVPKLQLK